MRRLDLVLVYLVLLLLDQQRGRSGGVSGDRRREVLEGLRRHLGYPTHEPVPPGFVLTHEQLDELTDPAVRELAHELLAAARRARAPGERRALTQREREVLLLLAKGLTLREIGQRMGVVEKTVETYRRRLGIFFGVGSRAAVVERAREQGFLTPDEEKEDG